MNDATRYRLLHGPYKTPRFRLGQNVMCSARGMVKIVGITSGRIAWPVGKTLRAKSLVLYRDLERAVRVESGLAICYWWGVTSQTVTKWRKALGIQTTPGTQQLRRAHFAEPWAELTRKKAWSKARDPGRREKIAASRRGKPRQQHVIDAMRKGRTGKPHTEETRRKMSESHQRRRGTTARMPAVEAALVVSW